MTVPALDRAAIALVVVVALAGCAQSPGVPSAPSDVPPPVVAVEPLPSPTRGNARREAADRQRELALRAQAAADLPAAIRHAEVLVLLEPGQAAHEKLLASLRETSARELAEHVQEMNAARKSGDLARARARGITALWLDPDNAAVKQALREIEAQVMARAQADRAARARSVLDAAAPAGPAANAAAAKPRPSPAVEVDLEQGLEMVRAGDTDAGVRELKAWVEANPRDKAGRERAGGAVADRAREAEAGGSKAAALALYDQASALAGASKPEWSGRAQALRKSLSEQQYAEGVKAMRVDLNAAIRYFEASLRYDADNLAAQRKLKEAKTAQARLSKINPR